jgi:hypothetical protein
MTSPNISLSPRSIVFWRHVVGITAVLMAQHPRLYENGMMFLGLWLGTVAITVGGAGLVTALGYLFCTTQTKGRTWRLFVVVAWSIAILTLFGEWLLPTIVGTIPAVSRTSASEVTETAKTVEGAHFAASSKCDSDQSCSSGLYCISGQCRQRGTARASCDRPIECAEGFECRAGHCEAEYKPPNLAKGARCATDGECTSTLYCIFEVCSEQAKTGQPCARNTDCTGDLRCNNGVCMKAKS